MGDYPICEEIRKVLGPTKANRMRLVLSDLVPKIKVENSDLGPFRTPKSMEIDQILKGHVPEILGLVSYG